MNLKRGDLNLKPQLLVIGGSGPGVKDANYSIDIDDETNRFLGLGICYWGNSCRDQY